MPIENEELLGIIPDDEILEDEEIPSKTYSLNFSNGRIGKKIDGLEAVKQAITKALLTPRFHCLIYNTDYGSEIQDEMSNAPSPNYLMAVIPDLIEDTLLPDERILSVSDFDIKKEGDKIKVSFNVQTVFGNMEIKEVY